MRQHESPRAEVELADLANGGNHHPPQISQPITVGQWAFPETLPGNMGAHNDELDLGPLSSLVSDPTVSDILVNSANAVYVERAGRLELTSIGFASDAQLLSLIERIVARVGRRVDEISPLVDARLPDGSRVNAVVPSVAIDGPSLSIRRFGHNALKAEQLVEKLALTESMLQLLQGCIKARLNLIISGGTGSGKTTLLNALSASISPTERIVSIEDAAELQLQQPHVVRMETRPANIEGRPPISIRNLGVLQRFLQKRT